MVATGPLKRHRPKDSLWSTLNARRTPPWLTLIGREVAESSGAAIGKRNRVAAKEDEK
ncbi:hypothetical protein AiwAL_11295 [Acidiphilium sp. AL]|uniref:Uncharacterized protein n=1 Tax=Acidiphilium iwatense TaxID=768198 RepID=A0ABS9DZD7_9PROT|nr:MULTISPECIES: hypothetical protein [Acidiphilium]MCF3947448.1 hypothetical protein [Acidiphilium iwatense]MCU4160687.1 hypothetical protein [Acidiphilium sp. AL]